LSFIKQVELAINVKVIKGRNQMGQLHELLAVETAKRGAYKKILEETGHVFSNKPELFMATVRELQMFDENIKSDFPTERTAMATTVDDKLEYVSEFINEFLDIAYQREATNQLAKADIVVNDKVILKDVPATFLLGLEGYLKEIRQVFEKIPTLSVSVEWEKDESFGKGVFRQKFPEEKLKTALQFKSTILAPATDKHPAQIEKWQEQVPVGKFLKHIWSGMISSSKKSETLSNIDTLLDAVKKARQRANCQECVTKKVGHVFTLMILDEFFE
jgi:hypothetical protein